jgi:hypothetical protein
MDDGIIVTIRTQITLDPEMQRRTRQEARELDMSLAEYIRHQVLRDSGNSANPADPFATFELGNSGGSDIANNRMK